MSAAPQLPLVDFNAARIAGERKSQRLVTAFVLSGIFFMLLPGTFLGVWNLLSISQAHDATTLSQAWLQAHGQAQLFGWIGSFILGIGFYSLTKFERTRLSGAHRLGSVVPLDTGGDLPLVGRRDQLELEGGVAIICGLAVCCLSSLLQLPASPWPKDVWKAGSVDADCVRGQCGLPRHSCGELCNPVPAGMDRRIRRAAACP
jgi:hypothetical protein